MTMIDIGQFANIEINWYETKLIYPFRYSEGIHYFMQKDQRWIVDEIAKWVKETHFKEDFPSVIDWKLKVNPCHSATLTCENRRDAVFKFGFMTVFPETDIELYYDGDRINEIGFCLIHINSPSEMCLMLEKEKWTRLCFS